MIEKKNTNTLIAPGLLIAPPIDQRSYFSESVILMTSHESDGSMGFVLNKTAPLMLSQVFNELELELDVPDRPVLSGGPVSEYVGFILYEHQPHEPHPDSMMLTPTLSISPAHPVLEAAGKGVFGDRFELLLGYSGWGPGQLDNELETGYWLHYELVPGLLFQSKTDGLYQQTCRHMGIELGKYLHVQGGAQA